MESKAKIYFDRNGDGFAFSGDYRQAVAGEYLLNMSNKVVRTMVDTNRRYKILNMLERPKKIDPGIIKKEQERTLGEYGLGGDIVIEMMKKAIEELRNNCPEIPEHRVKMDREIEDYDCHIAREGTVYCRDCGDKYLKVGILVAEKYI